MFDEKITLLIAGDFIPPQSNLNIYSKELANFLKDKDFSLVNLETPLTNSKDHIKKAGSSFKVIPDAIKHLKDGFFDAVTLSNNHIRDYGDEGVISTIDVCRSKGIMTVGAGANLTEAKIPLRIVVKGKRIAILNYSEREFNVATKYSAGANPYDNITAYYDIREQKKLNDYIIVIYHGGIENQFYPTPEIITSFKFIIDAGADLVAAHHTHRFSGIMLYNNKPLFFGLGNFICPTKTFPVNEWQIGLIVKIVISNGSFSYKIMPVRMAEDFDKIDLLQIQDAKRIKNDVNLLSQKINDEKFLNEYWVNIDKSEFQRILNLLYTNSKFTYRIHKYLPFLSKNKISDYRKNILLNMVRCDSHRNRLIRILENLNN